MSKFCKNCSSQLKPDTKFCSYCGTKVQEAETSSARTVRTVSEDIVTDVTKPQIPPKPKKLLLSAVAAVLVIALGAAILPRLGKEVDNTDGMIEDLSTIVYTERDYTAKAKELTVSPERPSASAHGVTIEFGEHALEGDETLKVRELPEKADKTNGVKVTAYDFKLGDKANFDDVITIAIPYDTKYAEAGAERECIGAKYYNQTTGEWEGVYYDVDVKNQQVLIYTTHLSTYGVFQVKNENTRKAYITDIYAIAGLLNSGKSFEVIKELAEAGQPGNAAFEAGFEAINSVVGNTGTAVTAITLGGQYEGALAEALGSGSQHLGLALAAVQTCYDFTNNFSDDQGKLSTLSNLVKNIANNAVGYFGSATLQVGFAGVAVFDVVLSTVQSDMMELKLENLGGVYQYYNDVEAPRSNKEWRRIFISILKKNADDPEKAKQLINQEIDSFCDRFWSFDYGKVKEIAAVSGLKYSFDERQWTKDREVLTKQYREYLMTRLQASLTSARNYLLNQAMEQAQKEFEKQLRTVQKELNKTVKVQIIEQPEKEGDYKYEGYTVSFAPISGITNAKNWTGKMPKGGEMNTSFTILGHIQSGSPNRIELYPAGKNSPEVTVSFKVSYPITTILISSSGKEKLEQQSPIESGSEPSVVPEAKPQQEFAWMLVDTIHRDQKDDIENTNKGGVYQVSASASPGNYTYTHKYIGETDTYPDPDQLNGESYATQLTMSVPPTVIKGGETVALSFNLSFTDDNISYFDGTESARADWGNLKFTNTAKKSNFEIYSSVKYSSKNVKSVSDTISAVIPNGDSEGQQEKLWTGGYTGTYYVYEWKQTP